MNWRIALPLIALLCGGLVAGFPSLFVAVVQTSNKVRQPAGRPRFIIPIAIFVVAFYYFLFSAQHAGRDLSPRMHDEFMYLLQARMLSHGKLWMPQSPIGEFFESFNVVVRPVYASVYFPGTALFYVPGTWLQMAPWITSLAICAGAVTVFYLILTSLIDGTVGILGALLLISLEQLRTISVSVMSHSAMMLLALLTFWSYLQWRRERKIFWALTVGFFAGWGAATRPVDALCIATPIGLAMFWELYRSQPRSIVVTAALLVAGAAPFLALQLVFNRGVTGHWFQTPFGNYVRTNFPGLAFGVGPHPTATPPSPLPQIHDLYDQLFRRDIDQYDKTPFLHVWLVDRLFAAIDISVPSYALLLLIPVGLFFLRNPARLAIAGWLLTMPLAYSLYPSYLSHYGLVVTPSVVCLIVFGIEALSVRWRRVGLGLTIAAAMIAIGSLPEISRKPDRFLKTPFLDLMNYEVNHLPHTPAVVLFRYAGQHHVHDEPVFNIDTAWPDDAEVIRAHDLGDKDRLIYAYYAARQPDRFFYLYDRSRMTLIPLGYAKDLAGGRPATALPKP